MEYNNRHMFCIRLPHLPEYGDCHTDNINCPAVMSDGRHITNHQSTKRIADKMMIANGFNNSNDFRSFFQNHGDLFLEAERCRIDKAYGMY